MVRLQEPILSIVSQVELSVSAGLHGPGSSRRASQPKPTQLPSGGQWLHEIKHDGFRVIARKDGERVRLYSRPGNDLTTASRSLSRR
jgi:hypothetical protein